MTTEQTGKVAWWDSVDPNAPTGDAPRRASWSRAGTLFGLSRSLLVLLLLLPLIGALLGLAAAALTPTRYTSHAYLLIIDTSEGADVSAVNIAQATARIATESSVLQASGGNAALLRAAEEGDLGATASPDAPLIDLSASAGTREEAVKLANDLTNSAENHVSSFGTATRVRAEVFAPASRPNKPTSPSFLINALAGLALGVLASAALLVARRR